MSIKNYPKTCGRQTQHSLHISNLDGEKVTLTQDELVEQSGKDTQFITMTTRVIWWSE